MSKSNSVVYSVWYYSNINCSVASNYLFLIVINMYYIFNKYFISKCFNYILSQYLLNKTV